MKKLVCLMASACVLSNSVQAQFNCGTDYLYQRQVKENPVIKEIEERLSKEIQAAVEKEKTSGTLFRTTAVTYDVPIVVHVVHDYGSEYLPDDAIFEAVKIWDQTYNKENADITDVIPTFVKYIGNPQIRLHLATIDPSGNRTKGITRRQLYLTSSGSDLAKTDGWPNDKYINVWFINKFNADHAGAAAYAYYPSSGAAIPWYDGVIGLAAYLNTDKAIPHEFGHVLNLQHTWGNTNAPGVACGDDLVEDTPPTYGHTSCTTADLYDTRCATGYTDSRGTFVPNNPAAADTVNTQNVMDYSYCARMFTIGQADRMRAALTSSVAGRNNLYSPANLASTGALLNRPDLKPIPDFSVEKGVLSWSGPTSERMFFTCQDYKTRFQFKNRSWNDTITDVSWSFSNRASTPTSTSKDGTVVNSFSDAGWVTVTLTANGNNSGSSTISRKAVYVASNTAITGAYNQYFTGESDFENWPMFNYYGNNFKWEYSGNGGYPNGAGCIRYRAFDARTAPERYSATAPGDYDDIFTPGFDLTSFYSSSSTLNLNFFTAGAVSSGWDGKDSLEVYASTACGETWTRIAVFTGGDLSNNGYVLGEFAPTSASQWRARTVAVPATMRSDKTFFRFRYKPTVGGNNLYFDNFSITPWLTDIKETAADEQGVQLYPNPTSGDTKLVFTMGDDKEASYTVRDITGKTILQKTIHAAANTFVQEQIERSQLPASGVYIVNLVQGNRSKTLKLVVQ